MKTGSTVRETCTKPMRAVAKKCKQMKDNRGSTVAAQTSNCVGIWFNSKTLFKKNKLLSARMGDTHQVTGNFGVSDNHLSFSGVRL